MNNFLSFTKRNILWFKRSFESGELQMKPPFQRNPVWTHPQQCYLIDTILRAYPIPELYIQDIIDESGDAKQKSIVVDGQQRIKACLEFIEGKWTLLESEVPGYGDMSFDDLSPDDKKKIYGYEFIVRLVPEIDDEQLRVIFKRLNRNVVALNQQELRHATYWGPFIKCMEDLSNDEYWTRTGVFTPNDIKRMLDIEFISEISVACLQGHQNKKLTLESWYRFYEEEFEEEKYMINLFKIVLHTIDNILPNISKTRWRKKSDFYSLFVALASLEDELPFSRKDIPKINAHLIEFGNKVDYESSSTSAKKKKNSLPITVDPSPDVKEYVETISRASSDLQSRIKRHEIVLSLLKA